MTLGLSAANFADVMLNYFLRQVAGTVPAGDYVQLHTDVGEPGAAGTSNVATGSGATRVVITFAAPAGTDPRTCTSSGTAPSWAAWTGGSVNIKYISLWSAITAGNFLLSAQLTTTKAITNTDTFTLSSLQVGQGPIAS